MNRVKKSLLLVLALVLVFGVTGCGKVAKLKNGQESVISFKKDSVSAISADDLYQELKNKYATEILVKMMDKKLFGDRYETTEEMKNYSNEQVTYWKNLYGDSFSSYLSYAGYADEDDMRESLILEKKQDAAVQDYVEKTIKDNDINNYYKNNFYGDVKASHILIKPDTTDDMTDKEKAEAKKDALKEANEVITKLKNGEKFEKLAKEYSDDETIDLGWFNDGEMEDSFFKATINLKKNKYTTIPIETSYGYHIILKTGEKKKPKLKEVKETIKEKLAKEKLEKDVDLKYESLMKIREEAGMEFSEQELKRKYKSYMNGLIQKARQDAANKEEK